ncbi:hypothetical protein EYF80_005483 [Liparis tanakae]|uniref:Uncharacterized protein n=1 Tax=Liparis tanakae TaxID=230148 RepID=A0A4Z2J1T9_9TELE|nr:hypothetical protein EYF80_005483 [Liparis tanakae]
MAPQNRHKVGCFRSSSVELGHLRRSRAHCGPLDTRSQYHGCSLGCNFLFLLAKNAGEHLPLGGGGPSMGPDGDAQLPGVPQDVNENVTAEQTHDAGESWAEGWRHRRTES